MKTLKNQYIVFVFIALFVMAAPIKSNAQEKGNTPFEKIYTQTDRPFYFPGETIWFKSYIVTEDNTASTLSDIMYAELISPKGSVVKTIKLSINQGYAYGDFVIHNDWVGGIYKIKTFTYWMRNYGNKAPFEKKITIQKIVKPNLLLSLKFEKEGYGKSSAVTANFKAEDLKNIPLKNTKIKYEVAVKGSTIISKDIKTGEDGKAQLTFQLPNDLKSRDVVLNVLIPFKGSTESISRSVPVVLDNIDLQFFPEGGKTIANSKNQIAFKAIDEFGKPVDVQGDIFNDQGLLITSFGSFHDGMGAFYLNPSSTQKYHAKISFPFDSERKISLPKIYKDGVNLGVQTDSLETKISIHSTLNKSLFLEVSDSRNTLLKKPIDRDQNEISIDTRLLPIGITKFRVTDKNEKPLAERLVFLNAHKQLSVDIQLEKEVYKTREKVKVTVTTKDQDNNPIPSNLSLAVVDNKLLSHADDKQDQILSYLLLSSELKGKIHKPSFYFNPEEEKSYLAIDYLMLTHGWRDYIQKPLIIKDALYQPEQLTVQTGRVIDKKGNPVAANLLLFDQNGNKVLVFKSNQNGDFSFKLSKSRRLILMAYTDDGKKLKILEKKKVKKYIKSLSENNDKKGVIKNEKPPSKFNNPIKQSVKKTAVASVSLSEDSNKLDEIVVASYGVITKRSLSASISKISTSDIVGSESVASLLKGRAPGVQITNTSGIYGYGNSITVRGTNSLSGNNQPLIIVDGVPYESEILSNINPGEINSIDVLKNTAATSLYGSSGANGVILVTTKSQNYYNNYYKKKLNNAKYNNYAVKTFYNYSSTGLYNSQLFYIPKYEGKDLPKERKDFRQTIYWNPVIQTDENGKAQFEFYNSDAITSFQIITEGVGYNGLIGHKKKAYATKKLLNIDFKLPNYLTLNDTIVLPVTITNESDKGKQIRFSVQLPKHLKLLEKYDERVFVNANSSLIRNIKVMPIQKAYKVNIGLRAVSGEQTDFVKKEAVILSPYFPTEVSVSGFKSSSYDFTIDHQVEGSLRADFTLYTDIVGDVMDGIEGIIREPYGCFEQVSSSTYPNILVLKYLKETNKSNPEIEKTALDFIKKGYKKLASYETSKDGFEWYGKAPPHEALTAYGLMEFTEMKEVYGGVSEPMLKRTINYLLSRRNGKGGFKQNRGKYGFSAAPENVNNAYIVYAISESGIDADIKREYDYTYNEALKSDDNYRMALMACASYNFGKAENAKKLIGKIKENIQNYKFSNLPVDNTITRSYGNAKNIETVAFTLLALMKEKNPDYFLISQGIEYLVSKRRYNRFGSTQSTSMALKALIEYTKAQKSKLVSKNNTIELIINGKSLKKELNMTKNGKIVIENIESYITNKKQNIQVKFSNSDVTFPYSLNVTYDSFLPESSKESPLAFETIIADNSYNVGDNVSMIVNVTNKKNEHLGMVTSVIGIPSGTTPQPMQLKEFVEQNKVAYYEIFDNYLVFYWRSLGANETKTLRLDLKADIAGSYQAPASAAYLYYGDEFKTWISGSKVKIDN